jgi:K+-sensing histidine kinase KdpD
MWLLKRMGPISISLAMIFAVTAVLFYFKDGQQGAQHLAFFYLLPTAFVAIVYGSVPSMLCAIAATLAAFPLRTDLHFYVSDPREAGDLIFFAGTALIGAKCTADVTHPPEKPGDATAKLLTKD